MARGRCPRAGDVPEVVIGSRLADKLRIGVGDPVHLALPVEELDELRVARRRFVVAGVLEPSGGFSVVEYGVFPRIEDLRALVGWKRAATSIHVTLKDAARSRAAVAEVPAVIGPGYRVQHWTEVNSDVQATIDGVVTMNRASQIMVILAVLIPTFALLWINVLRERRQIAVLAAIGFSRRALFAVYLLRASLVGAVGAALGALGGVLLCRWFQAHPLYAHHGFVVTPALGAGNLGVSVGLVLAVTVVGGLGPAIFAAWSNPALALRGS